MKTIDIGPDGMAEHIVRFNELQPKQGNYASLGIPSEAYEMLTAKTHRVTSKKRILSSGYLLDSAQLQTGEKI